MAAPTGLTVDYAQLRDLAAQLRAVHDSLVAASRQLDSAWSDALAGAGDYETRLSWGCDAFMGGHGQTLGAQAQALLDTASDLEQAVALLTSADAELARGAAP